MILSIGATRYTEFGENTYLKEGDEIIIVAYDSSEYELEDIKQLVENNKMENSTTSITLRQKVVL